ncbi:MAG: hypothetical protein Kow0042_17600 [Calditrichia bacterium]
MGIRRFNILIGISLLFWGCGGGLKLSENPQPLGFVPFSGSDLTTSADELNQHLLTALHNSGNFLIHPLDTISGFWDLSQMQAEEREDIQWILTGKFEYEMQTTKKGSRIPYLVFAPKKGYTVKIIYRLYNTQKKNWQAIGEIHADRFKGGDYQVLNYQESDPSLFLSAKERQVMRGEVLEAAAQKLAKQIVSQMNKK